MIEQIGLLISVSGVVISLYPKLEDYYKKEGIKKELRSSLDNSFNEFGASVDEFIISFYQIAGALNFSALIGPFNCDEVSDYLVEDLNDSVNNLEDKSIKLVNNLKDHSDSLKIIAGADWVKVEALFSSIDSNKIDYNHFLETSKADFKPFMSQGSKFRESLNNKINDFSKEKFGGEENVRDVNEKFLQSLANQNEILNLCKELEKERKKKERRIRRSNRVRRR